MNKWDSYCDSIAGRRETNEDGVLILPLGGDGFFCAVADGMGGVKGGEVASGVVLDYAKEFLAARFLKPVHANQLKKILRDLYAGADEAVGKAQKANPNLAGMGTTLACILASGRKYVVGNIGDGRVYRSRGGSLSQLTRDHTYVQEMITSTGTRPDAGVLKNFGHILTRSIEGGKDTPDLFPLEEKCFTLSEGEGFLLCSDGLILDKGAEHELTLERIFIETASLKEAAAEMVDFALTAGSTDNISVLLATWGQFTRTPRQTPVPPVRPDPRKVSPPSPEAGKRIRPRLPTLLSLALLAVLALVALFVIRAFGETHRDEYRLRSGCQSMPGPDSPAGRPGARESNASEQHHLRSDR